MKLKKELCLFFILATTLGSAQNLVLNPGLENYITCPGFGQFGNTWVNDWYKPSWGSSDYYHASCPSIIPPLPGPNSGNGEAGIILYNYGTEYREYITASLIQPLLAGQLYDVEFYISLNNGYIQAIQEAGAFLSDSIPGPFLNSLTINVTPQVKNNNGFLSYGWQKISGTITAAGGETYITIGNFNNDSNTTTLQVGSTGSYGSYYFIDDVYVGKTDSVPSGISSVSNYPECILPGLIHEAEPFQVNLPFMDVIQVDLFNITGAKSGTYILSGSSWLTFQGKQAGLYFYTIQHKGNLISRGKIIIST